jgi:hypothetical protein
LPPCKESPALVVKRAIKANLAPSPVHPVPLDLPDLKANRASLARFPVHPVPLDLPDLKAIPVQKVPLAPFPVRPEQQGQRELQVRKDCKAIPVQKAIRAVPVPQERKDLRATRAIKATPVHRACRASPDRKANPVRLDQQDRKDQQVLTARFPVRKVTRAIKVIPVQQVPPVLTEQMEPPRGQTSLISPRSTP